MIEVPMYFTQDELMQQFAQQRKQMDKMQQDITAYDRGGGGNSKMGKQLGSKKNGYADDDDIMLDDTETPPIDERLLDDLFVKGEMPKQRDPFHFANTNSKIKKDDSKSATADDVYAAASAS